MKELILIQLVGALNKGEKPTQVDDANKFVDAQDINKYSMKSIGTF